MTALPIKAWHIAGAVGGILTWVMWVLAHKHRIAMKNNGLTAAEEWRALRIIQGLLWARAALLTYTAFCGLVAVFKTLQWASVEVRWLP